MGAPLRIPSVFRSLELLRTLSIVAMGLSLAAATGGAFSQLFGAARFVIYTGLPTALAGVLWGVALRSRSTVGKTRLRWGWLASIPIAMANGALAAGLMMAGEEGRAPLQQFAVGLVLGATFGALMWIPGLLLTLGFFGVPVAWSQRLAKQGLSGEERGEGIVSIASFVLALVGLLIAFSPRIGHAWHGGKYEDLGRFMQVALSSLGLAVAGSAAVLAGYRTSRRRRFVSDVEAGKIRGYRVDDASEGKVLVRITSVGEGYRVADVEEEVVELDDGGEAVREKVHIE